MKKVIIGLAAVVLFVAAGVLAYTQLTGDEKTPEATTSATSQSSIENGESPGLSQTTSITYTNNGFNPGNISVTAGTTVTVTNNSSGELEFSSDPHPTHTENQELNTEKINAGESISFTPTIKGTWGFHNHVNSAHTGTIIVE